MGSIFVMCDSLPRDLSFIIQGSDINVITISKTSLNKLVLVVSWMQGSSDVLGER